MYLDIEIAKIKCLGNLHPDSNLIFSLTEYQYTTHYASDYTWISYKAPDLIPVLE
jgi:hypothetical protein